ncbi:DUF4230 domain-containing protein [Sphingomicrobium astaxanthinifaciens]|uniref:DUF4230 domain-containing protein n=1 Tax=Sphingomicrobium astaxanthinifaciens TaxID=1227949 RepID=UPI001FCBC080|nr:DUF4230 domain-containing protein [Sphingomicrobium astaxanthinifaciens]MCJ7421828.1 DUF4230 domain-containing protein [Sphingomicrobium astaxanthinifaciens]
MDRTSARGPGLARPLVIAALAVAVALAVFLLALALLDRSAKGPDPETVVATSLQSLQAQNRLVPFSARFVSVVTSRQRRLAGLASAERTLILPGTARYELDLAALEAEDLAWDAASRTLTVTLPELEVAGPEVDLDGAREYGEDGLLAALTDSEAVLTRANRRAALADLRKQAGGRVPMGLAREAARDAVEANFALPLRVAGLDSVRVVARFASDPSPSTEQVDVSTSYEDAIAAARQRRAAQGEEP